LGLADLKTYKVDNNSGYNQQNKVFFLPVPIEEIAGSQQEHPFIFLRYKKIDGKNNAKKNKKIDRVENHL
jgi:hypothetical protein